MAQLPAATLITTAGTDVTTLATAAATSQTIANPDGKTGFDIHNGSGGSITVTIPVVQTVPDGKAPALAVGSRVVTVPNGKTYRFGGFEPSVYNDPATQSFTVNIDVVTIVTIQAFTR